MYGESTAALFHLPSPSPLCSVLLLATKLALRITASAPKGTSRTIFSGPEQKKLLVTHCLKRFVNPPMPSLELATVLLDLTLSSCAGVAPIWMLLDAICVVSLMLALGGDKAVFF